MAELGRGGMASLITMHLMQGRIIYPSEYAAELGVSLRNVYKVLADVQAAGVPVTNVKGLWFVPLECRIRMGVSGGTSDRKQDSQSASQRRAA